MSTTETEQTLSAPKAHLRAARATLSEAQAAAAKAQERAEAKRAELAELNATRSRHVAEGAMKLVLQTNEAIERAQAALEIALAQAEKAQRVRSDSQGKVQAADAALLAAARAQVDAEMEDLAAQAETERDVWLATLKQLQNLAMSDAIHRSINQGPRAFSKLVTQALQNAPAEDLMHVPVSRQRNPTAGMIDGYQARLTQVLNGE